MKVIGVTGTNGKTTVSQMLAAVFNAGGQKSAVIGTLEGDMTTPEAPVLQRRLRELHEDGVSVVAMEVSSHSLVQHRVRGQHLRLQFSLTWGEITLISTALKRNISERNHCCLLLTAWLK